MEMPICSDRRTGQARSVYYDEHGYAVLVGGEPILTRRLEAVCYLVGARDREKISLIHALQDAGEPALARWVAHGMHSRKNRS